MSESFYALLGVDADADEETLRAAYRDQVKRHHPDVSDEPDAGRRFRRLTTARDVLLDPDERERYDRLGHATYVERHVDSPRNTGPDESSAANRTAARGGGDGPTRERRRRHRHRNAGGADAHGTARGTDGGQTTVGSAPWEGTWPGESGSGPTTTGSGEHRRRRCRRRHVRESPGDPDASTAEVDEPWQHASAAYRRSAAASAAAAEQRSGDLADAIAAVGPWMLVHVVVLLSAIATVVVTLSEGSRYVHLTVPALVGGLVLIGGVTLLVVLHLVSRVYT